jgi:hypothetical protein
MDDAPLAGAVPAIEAPLAPEMFSEFFAPFPSVATGACPIAPWVEGFDVKTELFFKVLQPRLLQLIKILLLPLPIEQEASPLLQLVYEPRFLSQKSFNSFWDISIFTGAASDAAPAARLASPKMAI